MRHCASVPELCVHQAALLVDGIRNPAPAANLMSAPETRRIGPTVSIGTDLRTFTDDESRGSALRVVFGVKFGRRMLGVGRTHASKRRHDDPVP
jgi:hypothetical protein